MKDIEKVTYQTIFDDKISIYILIMFAQIKCYRYYADHSPYQPTCAGPFVMTIFW